MRGFASFLDPQTLLVTQGRKQQLVTASTFIIATGSVITRVPVPGLWETGCWTSDTALDTDEIPKRLAVLGGGVIAVELGQFFARVGSKTTILQRSKRIVRNYDPDVSLELERAFKAEKLDVRTGVKLIEVSKKGKGKKIVFQCGRKTEEIVVDEILYAMGREPAPGESSSRKRQGCAGRGETSANRRARQFRAPIFSPPAMPSGRMRWSTSRFSRAKRRRAMRSTLCAAVIRPRKRSIIA